MIVEQQVVHEDLYYNFRWKYLEAIVGVLYKAQCSQF